MQTLKAILADLNGWVTRPIVGQVDAMHLFLVTGLVLVFLIMWSMILAHVRMATEAL